MSAQQLIRRMPLSGELEAEQLRPRRYDQDHRSRPLCQAGLRQNDQPVGCGEQGDMPIRIL